MGNPRIGDLYFCLRNEKEDLIYAKAAGLGETTNVEAEILTIREA